jgi:uncharacterized SAM-binding protein YcdF (DUF218 family)
MIIGLLILLSLAALLAGWIAIRLAIARQQAPQPQIIFILGGDAAREHMAAQLAQTHPNLPLWLSTGTPKAPRIFQEAQIDPSRIRYDCRATDTVTNFTTVVEDFHQFNIRHAYVLTSSYHMPRAEAIATVVFGSHGIAFTPVYVPSWYPSDSMKRVLRDVGRSLVWLVTGRTGSSFNGRMFAHCPPQTPIQK